jgi:hypothetical protein
VCVCIRGCSACGVLRRTKRRGPSRRGGQGAHTCTHPTILPLSFSSHRSEACHGANVNSQSKVHRYQCLSRTGMFITMYGYVCVCMPVYTDIYLPSYVRKTYHTFYRTRRAKILWRGSQQPPHRHTHTHTAHTHTHTHTHMPITYWSVYMVYLRRMRIHICDIWRSNIWCVYVVYVWTWSKCEDIKLTIYLIPYPHIYSMSIRILRRHTR